VTGAKPEIAATVERMQASISAAVRTTELVYGTAETATDLEGVRVDIVV
jgi:hypothetical protein